MRHIFEYDSWYFNNAGDPTDYNVEVGDKLYCINNRGVSEELEIGKGYTVDKVWGEGFSQQFRLAELGSRWMKYRFSKDPNHISIVMYRAKNYNL